MSRIEDYALLGDCESAALVSKTGSIDWLCWPRFDSGALFAGLLGDAENGCWSIKPIEPAIHSSRRYVEDTLILETDFETARGGATVIDFMAVEKGQRRVIRLVRGRHGTVEMEAEIRFRFDYGSIVPWVTRLDEGAIKAVAGPDAVLLHGSTPLRPEGFKHAARFAVSAGETVSFVLSHGSSFAPPPEPVDPLQALKHTQDFWRTWISRHEGPGPYAQAIRRSLLTLKALTYRPTGGIVAAPTTSLPEKIGGPRNWDYRFCWLRDATFTLLALLNAGFSEEASEWRAWLRRAVAGRAEQVQIMYGVAGERRIDEWEVPWLSGYEGSRPVRIGNAAAKQLQIDIYGEVMDALLQSCLHGLPFDEAIWGLELEFIRHLLEVWREPDEGLWEVRRNPRQFTHSKVMAWVAMDRAIKMAELFGLDAPVGQWREIKDQIHRLVCEEGYNRRLGAFVQSFGSSILDASALLIPLVGFLPSSDPRVLSTVSVIEKQLMPDGLVRRYDTGEADDGLDKGEGAFLPCTFWLADNLVLQGRREEAADLFHFLLSLRNDVGLLSEEYDREAGRMLGNFPQAISHVALVNTAFNLSEAGKPAEQRSGGVTPCAARPGGPAEGRSER